MNKLMGRVGAAAALLGAAYAFPALAFPLSLALPVWGAGRRWDWLALPAALCAGFWLAGGDALLALCLLAAPMLTQAAAMLARQKRLGIGPLMLAMIAALLTGLLLTVLRGGALLGGHVLTQAAERITQLVRTSAHSGNLLVRLLNVGLLGLPAEYRGTTAYQLGEFVVIDPALQRELLKQLRSLLTDSFTRFGPALMMQTGITAGVFAALGAARREGLPEAPAFQTLRLPRRAQGYLLARCVSALVLQFCASDLCQTLCTLTYSAFTTVYRLLGAATLVFLLDRKKPERSAWHGVLAALLYLFLPFVLLILGVADQFANLRASSLFHQEED